MKTPTDPSRLAVRVRRAWFDEDPDPNTDPTPQYVFESNLMTLDDRHLSALARQIADGVQTRLGMECNCLESPTFREVVADEAMKMMRIVLAHQRSQAAQGHL